MKAANLGIALEVDGWEVCVHTHSRSGLSIDLTEKNQWKWAPISLPFGAITWVQESGEGPDPMVETNDLHYRWIEEVDWVLRKTFTVSPEDFQPEDELQLVLNRLDCYCDVYLNDTFLGTTANQFREHTFDVEDLRTDGPNELLLYIRSARNVNNVLESAYGQLPALHDSGRVHSRRSQALTGWDFTPRLSGASLMEAPVLRHVQPISIAHPHVYVQTLPTVDLGQETAENVTLSLHIDLASRRRGTGEILWEIVDMETGAVLAERTEPVNIKPRVQAMRTTLELPEARLWWPAGVGGQPQYRARVTLTATDRLEHTYTSTQQCTFGVRTVAVDRSRDPDGEAFAPVVNQHPIFLRGANWLPINMLPGRQTEADYRQLISRAHATGINALRVWGGGIYESDLFYDLCDQAGILVWQDFMFASAAYPVYREFLDEVEAEAAYQVLRLRNHPSLFLWCGNSANEWLHQTGVLKKGNEQRIIGEVIWTHTLREVVEDFDPSRTYHQSSPFGRTRTDCNAGTSGDRHQWQVWDGWESAEAYYRDHSRFISEFGIQSFPCFETLQTHIPSAARLTDVSLVHHQCTPAGIERIVRYVSEHCGIAERDFKGWVEGSQATQAALVARAVEHWRRRKSKTAGCLIWHFNDPYPGVSWSMLDFEQRPKAVMHAAARFFSPLLLSLEILINDAPAGAVPPQVWPQLQPEGVVPLSMEGLPGFQCPAPPQIVQCKLHLINDTSLPFSGTLRGGFYHGEDEVEPLPAVQVEVAPNGVRILLTHELDSRLMTRIRELRLKAELHLDEASQQAAAEWEQQMARTQRQLRAAEADSRAENAVPLPSLSPGLHLDALLVEPKYFQGPK